MKALPAKRREHIVCVDRRAGQQRELHLVILAGLQTGPAIVASFVGVRLEPDGDFSTTELGPGGWLNNPEFRDSGDGVLFENGRVVLPVRIGKLD